MPKKPGEGWMTEKKETPELYGYWMVRDRQTYLPSHFCFVNCKGDKFESYSFTPETLELRRLKVSKVKQVTMGQFVAVMSLLKIEEAYSFEDLKGWFKQFRNELSDSYNFTNLLEFSAEVLGPFKAEEIFIHDKTKGKGQRKLIGEVFRLKERHCDFIFESIKTELGPTDKAKRLGGLCWIENLEIEGEWSHGHQKLIHHFRQGLQQTKSTVDQDLEHPVVEEREGHLSDPAVTSPDGQTFELKPEVEGEQTQAEDLETSNSKGLLKTLRELAQNRYVQLTSIPVVAFLFFLVAGHAMHLHRERLLGITELELGYSMLNLLKTGWSGVTEIIWLTFGNLPLMFMLVGICMVAFWLKRQPRFEINIPIQVSIFLILFTLASFYTTAVRTKVWTPLQDDLAFTEKRFQGETLGFHSLAKTTFLWLANESDYTRLKRGQVAAWIWLLLFLSGLAAFQLPRTLNGRLKIGFCIAYFLLFAYCISLLPLACTYVKYGVSYPMVNAQYASTVVGEDLTEACVYLVSDVAEETVILWTIPGSTPKTKFLPDKEHLELLDRGRKQSVMEPCFIP
jgi:hypothetical protein